MAATRRDVAVLAGVSVKTVSNVVNGYAFVKDDNRSGVEQAIPATGYRPDPGARNLRRGRTGFVALVVPELGIPYFGELAALVITAAQDRDRNVLIEQTQGTRERERSTLASRGPHLIDGAIVSPLRLNGYRAALEAAGIAVPGGLVAPVDHHHHHRRDGAVAMHALLDRREPPDAAFCSNDLLAVGALRAAADCGVRVPEDVAVVGFDGTGESLYTRPALTTISPDKEAIARAAIELLARRTADAEASFDDVQTPYTLQVRESTASVR